MPPLPPKQISPPQTFNEKLLPAHPASSIAPLIGALIVIALVIFGGLYFWGSFLNQQHNVSPLPLIPADTSSQTAL